MSNLPIQLIMALAISAHASLAAAQAASPPASAASEPGLNVNSGTVAETLEKAKALPGASVTTTKPDAWVIVTETGGMKIWSFTPPTHYAYPAVVLRHLKVRDNGDLYVEMTGHCEADKAACDKLMKEFEALNERMRQQVQNRLKKSTSQ